MIARFILIKEMFFDFARYPINPPAKESPAPVGSNTDSNGKAGAKNIPQP